MLRSVLIFAICAGLSAAVPLFYRARGDAAADQRPMAAPSRSVSTEEPAPRPATGSLSGRRERIAADRSGHFLAEFRLNRHRVKAMVDTGATYVAINRSTARSAGIPLQPADFKYAIDTANGATLAAVTTLDRVELGRIHVENVEAVVLEDKALSGTLIGMSFLKRLQRYGVEDDALLLAQ